MSDEWRLCGRTGDCVNGLENKGRTGDCVGGQDNVWEVWRLCGRPG